MKKKQWIIVGVVAVAIIVIAIAASQTTKRAEYQQGDLVISYDSSDPAGVASIDYMKAAAEGTGINVIALDPAKNPKGIPLTDAANMNVLGAMLFYGSDGEHVHESLVYEQGYITSPEQAQQVISYIVTGGQPASQEATVTQ